MDYTFARLLDFTREIVPLTAPGIYPDAFIH